MQVETNLAPKLTVLGSGAAMSSYFKPFDYRHPAAHLVQAEGKNMLLDCSGGVQGRLNQIQFDYYNLDAIFISHFHPDHFTIEPLIPAFYERALREKDHRTLSIYGPKGIGHLLTDILDKKHYPGYMDKFQEEVNLTFTDFSDQKPVTLTDKISITPFKVPHGASDAYSMRLQIADKVLSYSGDSGESDNLVKAAQNADLFLCEAWIGLNDALADPTRHLSSHLAGKTARNSKVKRLVLTHYNGQDSVEVMVNEVRRSGFTLDVEVAGDFDSYRI
jgi:ribonuclease BN (tRNA processing enzyme)